METIKLLFFSDVHGNAMAVQELFRHADALRADRLILLGDVLYHEPHHRTRDHYAPERVAELLNSRKDRIIAVRGNCDSDGDQARLEFPLQKGHAEIQADARHFFLTHGHRWNEWQLPPVPAGTVVVHGHTHIPEHKELACGITIFNPGSISLPRQGHPATFGWFDGTTLTVRRLDDGSVYNPAN